jgi:hypothetical protein
MLRILEHGERVRLVETTAETHAVDTHEDLNGLRLTCRAIRSFVDMVRLYDLASLDQRAKISFGS